MKGPGIYGTARAGAAALAAAAFLLCAPAAYAEDPLPAEVLKAQVDNLIGDPTASPIPVNVLKSPPGQERFIDRRTYLARHAAIGSVPYKVLGWRMPGSQLSEWVEDVRKAAGVPASEISENPSYREVMHALTVDRFNTGKYAAGQITDPSVIAREKLIMSTLQLMQLRDYYELLERTALVLAVQLAIMTDEMGVPGAKVMEPH